MEGSPRMIPRQNGAKFHPSPSVTPLGTKSTTSSSVSFNKKTIRNYTPQASSNMLREFEDRRNNSIDWREKEKRASSQPAESHSTPSNRGSSKGQSKELLTYLEVLHTIWHLLSDFKSSHFHKQEDFLIEKGRQVV
jgi:hypothetical protein